MNRQTRLVVLYAFFAGVAAVANLLLQRIVFVFWTGQYSLYLGMAAGTGGGLLVKYILDKRYIFNAVRMGLVRDFRRFVLYSGMGVATTAVFWVSEIAGDRILRMEWGRYTGAAIGLTLGYVLKYRLDRKFVFRNSNR